MRSLTTNIFLSIAVFISVGLTAQIHVSTKDSAEYYVKKILMGEGIAVKNIKYTGHKGSIGNFSTEKNCIGVASGLVLSTGCADSINGPNQHTNFTSEPPVKLADVKALQTIMRGDKELKKAAKSSIFDMALLEFDFIPVNNHLSFNYVFASEEYPEYVGSPFNDVFCFFIREVGKTKSKNIALLKDKKTPITINNVNHHKNSGLYRKNHGMLARMTKHNKGDGDESLMLSIEFDGLTKVLKAECDVIPYKIYHMKIAIADAGDGAFDSAVFIESNSFTSAVDTSGKYYKVVEEIKTKNIKFNPDSIFIAYSKPPKQLVKDSVVSESKPTLETEVGHLIIYFDTNKSDLKASEQHKMDSLLAKYGPNTISHIELFGFTDSKGSRELNQKLAQKRNTSVRDYLLTKTIKAEQIENFESEFLKEADTNATEDGRSKNRRVELVFFKYNK